ncbi:hypothetical protein GH714_008646 [Hevea brasiliensis]|uniref:Uncharacterized protein n=1 Tax=Hevea brasiliensis TaxID=3981 RepID=A0A6A6MLE9_HEVBR|nr:hypothetical protein GH714_008646 [Hevea brasiliensis]
MFLRHHTISLSAISSFYTEHQKSPFANQPWDNGSLRFKFILGGSPPSPWEDFQSNRKILSVIGVCHCPSSPDLNSIVDQFSVACKSYASALVTRCFAFCPCDSQLEDGGKKGENLRLFPPADRQTLEIHLQTMMQEIAASLLMEFEKWVLRAESAGTILKTPLDSQASLSSEEVIKAKKRRLARAQKTMGDYCLMAGSPIDANAHYSTALELARLTADFFWFCEFFKEPIESINVELCLDNMCRDQMGQKDADFEDEVRYRYISVISHYKKSFTPDNAQRVSPLSFELEATLKLARFLCRRGFTKDVVELLTSAADGAKSLIDASDRLILYVEIARLFGSLGYQRKAAFFSRQVVQLYMQQENRLAAMSAMQVLAMTTKAYRVQSRASFSNYPHSSKEIESSHADSGKMHHQSVVSLFESQWSTLQMVVLREILLAAVRSGDPLAAWSAAARLLRSYYPLITPAGQNGLASALTKSAQRLPSGTRCADPALPFVRLYSFPPYPCQMDIVKRNPAREDWWAGSAPSGPFIYTPFSKGEPNDSSKQELIWIVGEPVQVITLSGIPTSVGSVTIPGCTVHCFGVISEHLFGDVDNLLLGAAQGLVLSDPFRCCGDGSIVLYEGEIRDVWISLANAGIVPVEQAHISLSEVILPVTLKAWQHGPVDPDITGGKLASGRPLTDSGDPPTKESVFPPGRRLVVPLHICVLQGLSFVKACLLSMEIPAHVGLNLPEPVHVETNGSKEAVGSKSKMDGLLKIDPFRGSWGLRFLELELSNPTDVVFEISVSVQLDSCEDKLDNLSAVQDATEYCCPKTRIDRDHSARVLIPLEHFKLPILDGSFFMKDFQPDGVGRNSSFSEKNAKAELNASIKNLISRIKVRWQSGRNSSGELNMKDAIQAALQTSVVDVLLPDPLTFSFRLVRNSVPQESDMPDDSGHEGSVTAYDMTPMEVIVRNNTKEIIRMSLSITCRDVAGENCFEGTKATVLWAGVLNGIAMEVPPLQESKHSFSLHFLVPGEYTLVAAAVIEEANDVLRTRAKTDSVDEPIFCRGPPFHIRVIGTA